MMVNLMIHKLPLYFIGALRAIRREGVQVLHCPELPNPEWGTVSITQNARGLFIAMYSCMPQHSIIGDQLRFCSPTSKRWSGAEPICLSCKTSILYACMYTQF